MFISKSIYLNFREFFYSQFFEFPGNRNVPYPLQPRFKKGIFFGKIIFFYFEEKLFFLF
jgi:hypothetical protein